MKVAKPVILFEDDDLVVVSKPPGLLCLPDRYNELLPNLYGFLTKKYGKIYSVHRLDKGTSGILIYAKKDDVHQSLSMQFQNRTIEKHYRAIVNGMLDPAVGSIEKSIQNDANKKGHMMIHDKGKASVTNYKVIEQFRQFALLDVEILTGRTHQIRIHMQSIGHPLLVDSKYGHRAEFFLSQIKRIRLNRQREEVERPLMHRTSLHAHSLKFKHPRTKKYLEFECELPKDFRAVLLQLRKNNALV